MNDTERAEAYLTLSQQLYTQHHDRRSLEWQIHLALWALLVAAGYAIVSNGKHLEAWSLILLLTVPLHAIWCVKIHRALVREQNLSIRYRKAAELLLSRAAPDLSPSAAKPIDAAEERSDMPDWLQRAFASYWWWLIAEVGTTLLIAIIVVRLAW